MTHKRIGYAAKMVRRFLLWHIRGRIHKIAQDELINTILTQKFMYGEIPRREIEDGINQLLKANLITQENESGKPYLKI